jgi:hypothetical protein
MSKGVMRGGLLLLTCVLLAQIGCAFLPGDRTHISGTVFGESLQDQEPGHSATVGIQATVICNGTAARTLPTGAYSLTLAASDAYHCTASAPPSYSPVSLTVLGSDGHDLVVNFGPVAADGCSWSAGATALDCSALRLLPGSLSGTITYTDSHLPAPNVTVQCWDRSSAMQTDGEPPTFFFADTDSTGRYQLPSLPAGPYGCVVGDHDALHLSTVTPAASSTLSFAICQQTCPPVTFHHGLVMHTFTAYLVFWLPGPYTFDATGSASTFEFLMARYFQDVGGTSFYNIVTQYWDYQGPIQNSVTLGGTYVDTRPYGHAANRTDPLTGADLQAEIERAMQVNHWSADAGHGFFIFTGYGAEICSDAYKGDCTFPSNLEGFCGYHDHTRDATTGTADLIYAVIPDVAPCVTYPSYRIFLGPNHDLIADEVIMTVSHEHFEMATDPIWGGWYTGIASSGEIGDECEAFIEPLRPDGSNVTLNHRHSYLVQEEWSNSADGCAFSL